MATIEEKVNFGSIIRLSDGTSWEINFLHKTRIRHWRPGQNVNIIPSENAFYPHILVNTDPVECAEAKPAK